MHEGTRREARERALSLLYEAEAKGTSPVDLLAEQPLAPVEFVADLVRGVHDHRLVIDELLTRYAVDWTLERMPAIDRSVLRLAVFELAERKETPVGVVISEAVELAKQYSTDDSGRFVNGLLSAIAAEVRAPV
jgi:N utilization substance protein B